MQKTCFILIAIAWLLTPVIAVAAPDLEMIVVCYPGGSVNIKDANGAMNAMLGIVERLGQWPEHSFNSQFTTKTDECRKLLDENNPKFAITSLGLYLDLRTKHNLVPIVQPNIKGRTTERYWVLTQKDKYKSLDELKNKTLGGTVLEESAFIGKIVFAGKYDPAKFFVLKTSNQAIHALRSLAKGELDAVILNELQFNGLASLHLEPSLKTVFTSEEIPLMGVVADSATTTEEQRNRFAKALEGMCADEEGKKLCALFGIESFVTVNAALFEPMVKLWAEER